MARHTTADYSSPSMSQEIKIKEKEQKLKPNQKTQPQYLERVVSLLFHLLSKLAES